MDIGAFSEDDFDAAIWINSTFKNAEQPQSNKDIFVSNLVSKLQLYVQQVNSALEDTSRQVLFTMPKIMNDAQNLSNEALTLRSNMNEVQSEIAQVQYETGTCMANLERLDDLKTKLQVAKQGIQESDGWGRLTAELEDLLERNEITNSCEKLQSLQRSLFVQKGLSGQLERESQVEGFKNRIEALASPSVVQCFTVGDIDQSKKYVEIFQNMGRITQLTQYYRTVQKGILQQHWSELCDLAHNLSTTNFLQEFYEYLFENCQKQIKWCLNVFTLNNNSTIDGSVEPIILLIESLNGLHPTRESMLTNFLKRSNDKLSILQEFSNANIYFGNIMEQQINLHGIKLLSYKQYRQLSEAIYDYFNIFINQHGSMEQIMLQTQLEDFNVIQLTVADTVRAIGNCNSKVFHWVDETIRRCCDITQNCSITTVVMAIKTLFQSLLERYKKCQQQLHASRSTEQDWSLLQICVSLLQHIGDFKIQIDDLERKICNIVLQKYDEMIKDDNNNNTIKCKLGYRISTKRELVELRKLVEISKVSLSNNYKLSVLEDTQEYKIFSCVFGKLKPICEYVHDTTLASIFSPIENQLKHIEPQPTTIINSTDSDLPNYSFAPQEFITLIGQYLLTLPQHLEPLLLSPSNQLRVALEMCDEQYTKNVPSADVLLSLLTDECCALYEERFGQICTLNAYAAKQIATDIEYLNSVLEELSLNLSPKLQHIAELLRAPSENYLTVSAGRDPKLVTAIRQMRNIISSE